MLTITTVRNTQLNESENQGLVFLNYQTKQEMKSESSTTFPMCQNNSGKTKTEMEPE